MSENASGSYYNTPRKARIKGAVNFLDYKGLPYFKSEVFAYNSVSKERGWAILRADNELNDRIYYNIEGSKRRGRPYILSAKDLLNIEKYL